MDFCKKENINDDVNEKFLEIMKTRMCEYDNLMHNFDVESGDCNLNNNIFSIIICMNSEKNEKIDNIFLKTIDNNIDLLNEHDIYCNNIFTVLMMKKKYYLIELLINKYFDKFSKNIFFEFVANEIQQRHSEIYICKFLSLIKDKDSNIINYIDSFGNSFLMNISKNIYIVKHILQNENIDISITNENEINVIHKIILEKSPDCLKIIVNYLLEKCNKNMAIKALNQCTKSGDYPILLAIKNNTSCGDILISTNLIDMNVYDSGGNTPIIQSIINKNTNLFQKILLIDNLDINKSNIFGTTPLIEAINCVNIDAIQKLINMKNIDINCKDSFGKTAFHKMLLAKYNYKNNLCKNDKNDKNDEDNIFYTIDNFAKFYSFTDTSNFDNTIFMSNCDTIIDKFLLFEKCNVNTFDIFGTIPLLSVCKNNDIITFNKLLNKLDKTFKDKNDKSYYTIIEELYYNCVDKLKIWKKSNYKIIDSGSQINEMQKTYEIYKYYFTSIRQLYNITDEINIPLI